MTTFDNDEMDEIFDIEEQPIDEEGSPSGAGSNRNFFLALGVLAGLFLVVTIALALLWLNNRQSSNVEMAGISATNAIIMTANAQTAMAATETSAFYLTPSVTPSATVTPLLPTVTSTPLLAQAATTTSLPGEGATGAGQETQVVGEDGATRSVSSALTQAVQQTQTAQGLSGTAAALPESGFADEVGLPGMFGMALGLVLVIVLVRRLRLSG